MPSSSGGLIHGFAASRYTWCNSKDRRDLNLPQRLIPLMLMLAIYAVVELVNDVNVSTDFSTVEYNEERK